MNRLELQTVLTSQLLEACLQSVLKLKQNVSGKVYAFILYPSSGFLDFGLAVSTRESLVDLEKNDDLGFDDELLKSLQSHPDLLAKAQSYSTPDSYYELTASEWEYVSIYPELFEKTNSTIAKYYDKFYDDGMNPVEISQFFKKIVIDVFDTMNSMRVFDSACFESSLLKGIQFPDNSNVDLVKAISTHVNSKEWHNKLNEYYDIISKND